MKLLLNKYDFSETYLRTYEKYVKCMIIAKTTFTQSTIIDIFQDPKYDTDKNNDLFKIVNIIWV